MSALHDLTALEQAAAIRSGELSSVELTEHYLDRSRRLSDEVGAFVTLTPELALSQARAADERVRAAEPDEPLAQLLGVVCPIKDLHHVSGVVSTYGSGAVSHTPDDDDNAVAKLREAGLVITGKTNTPEFGMPCYTEPDIAPPARTPWDLERSSGGSSGGAASAVAAGLAPIAFGSDGGGSIRIPASMTGLVGIKPSRGRVSTGPGPEMVGDMVTFGPLAQTVADAAALLDAMSGNATGDSLIALPPQLGSFFDAAGRDPGKLRIGVCTQPTIGDVPITAEVQTAIDSTVEALLALGHEIEEVNPPFERDIIDHFKVIWFALATIAPMPDQILKDVRPLTRWEYELGGELTAAELGRAVAAVRSGSRRNALATAHLDAVLQPTLAAIPAKVGELRNDADPAADFQAQMNFSPFCAPYNMTGQPSINVPLNWTEHDLPVGVQFIGKLFDEETIISLAAQLESARSWRARRPSIW